MEENMKKIIVMAITAILTVSLFAQNADYQAHLAKGKEYESQKKWVNALAEYYDAMVVEPTFDAVEAYNSYKQLSDLIENGNPGYGEYDDFEFYDAWIDIMKEYERYWSENPPRYFEIKIKRDSLNRENRTATYSTWIESNFLNKYKDINKLFSTGAQKAYKDDWSKCLKEWPKKSVWNSEKSGFLENNTPLVQSEWSRSGLTKDDKACAAITTLSGYSENVWFYDLKYNILADDGTIIFDGNRQILNKADLLGIGKTTPVQFTVSQETMNLLDSGKYKSVFKDAYLEYGKIELRPFADVYLENGKSIKIAKDQMERFWLKKLPEVKINLENIRTEKDTVNKYSVNFLSECKAIRNNFDECNALHILKQFSALKAYLDSLLESKQLENDLYKIYLWKKNIFIDYGSDKIKELFNTNGLLDFNDSVETGTYCLSDILNAYEKLQTCYEDIYKNKQKREEIVNENGWYVLIEEKEIKKPGYSPESEYYYYLVRKNNLVTE